MHTLFYLPCSVYLLSLTSAVRTRKVHVYFLSPVHAFLPSLFGLFAFTPASALRTRKVHVYFLSRAHAFLPSPFGLTIILPFLCPKWTSVKSGQLYDRRFESNRVESSRFDQLFSPSCVANRLPFSGIDYNTDDSSGIATTLDESRLP